LWSGESDALNLFGDRKSLARRLEAPGVERLSH
jgi:hypothetical protein